MSHTNSTTNYSLPQFITTDKPFWLTDVNQAYQAIDTNLKSVSDTASTASTNASQALLDAASAATTASAADAKGSGSVASIADAFDTTSTYSVGDLVMYNSLLYKCSVAVIDPGAWTGSANWTRTTLEEVFNTGIIDNKYHVGDSIDISNEVLSGAVATSTRILTFIPLSKEIGDDVDLITLSGSLRIYHPTLGYVDLTGTTITVLKKVNGVYVQIDLATALQSSYVNVSVLLVQNNTLTFSHTS